MKTEMEAARDAAIAEQSAEREKGLGEQLIAKAEEIRDDSTSMPPLFEAGHTAACTKIIDAIIELVEHTEAR